MITLTELYFLNSGWLTDSIIRVAVNGKNECHSIQGKEISSCAFRDSSVVSFANDFVIVKED